MWALVRVSTDYILHGLETSERNCHLCCACASAAAPGSTTRLEALKHRRVKRLAPAVALRRLLARRARQHAADGNGAAQQTRRAGLEDDKPWRVARPDLRGVLLGNWGAGAHQHGADGVHHFRRRRRCRRRR